MPAFLSFMARLGQIWTPPTASTMVAKPPKPIST
jgi:hypothetical protein